MPRLKKQLRLTRVAPGHLPDAAHRENAGVLEKERSFLGKEQVEAIEIDLLLVHLDLREVRAVGQVEGQGGGDGVLQIDAGVAQPNRAAALVAVRQVAGDVRDDLQTALRRRRVNPGQLPRQRQPQQVVLAGQRRPVDDLVAAADVPLDVHAPGLDLADGIAQGPERNGELGAPAGVRQRRAHLPYAVPVAVEPGAGATRRGGAAPQATLPGVHHLPVVLLPRRAGAEDETALPVEEGVENDLDAVSIVERCVPPAGPQS